MTKRIVGKSPTASSVPIFNRMGLRKNSIVVAATKTATAKSVTAAAKSTPATAAVKFEPTTSPRVHQE
jgi:hypothetical protein